MGRFIVRVDKEGHEPRYMEWTTVSDTPMSFGMPLEEFTEYYREQFGVRGLKELDQRIERADGPKRSSSRVPGLYDRKDLMSSFRWEWFTGLKDRPDGITLEELWHWYCDLREEPKREHDD